MEREQILSPTLQLAKEALREIHSTFMIQSPSSVKPTWYFSSACYWKCASESKHLIMNCFQKTKVVGSK